MTAQEKVISLAKSEVGYLEKKSNADLDSKTTNPGYNNWTKYARDLDAIGFYNGKKNGYEWCDMFFDWLLLKSFGLDLLMQMTGQTKGANNLGAACGYSLNYYKNMNRFFLAPQPGDQIFFWNSNFTAIAHTGLVVKVENGKVYTIEGNTSSQAGVIANGGCVAEKSYNVSYSRIRGYGRPKYELIKNMEDEIDMTKEELTTLIDERVKEILRGETTEPSNWIVKSGELEKAKEVGITDGTRPGGYAKREEVAAMVLRSLNKR